MIKSRENPIYAKRILIWEQNWLGDVLFSTPFIKAIRKKFKSAHITAIIDPSCSEILSGNPNIDEIIYYDKEKKHRSILAKLNFIMCLKKRGYDAVILLHRSLTRALITAFAGIKRRIGYFYPKRNFIMTDIIDLSKDPLHKIEHFLNIAKYLGCDTNDKKMEFFIDEKDRDYSQELLRQNSIEKKSRFVIINPGGNWPPKRWPEKNFAALSDKLIDEFGLKVVIAGSEGDLKRALRIQEMTHMRFAIICGKVNLKQFAAVCEKAEAVVSGDSGPMHIALAVGAKVIALFGPTSPSLTGPYGSSNFTVIQKDVGCPLPCYDASCENNRCMKAISAEDVAEAIKKGFVRG